MEFKNPLFFLLLLVLVPYIVWYVLRFKQSLPSLKVPDTTKYVKVPKTFRLYLMHMPFLLRLILMSLVVCILARPQSRHSWSNTDVEGIDIMLAVDVSTSMLAQDFKPNRVEALKEIAQRFIEKRPNDNMGLTMFAGEAYTQCPLTTDHTVLMNLYNSVDCNMAARGIIDDGTAIGDGIMNAILRLKESQAKSKVIILLTDGVNNSGNISPQTAAEIAKKYGIRIYTIGIGRNGMAPYPLPTGGTAMLPVEIDEQTMTKISTETGGQYFRAQKNAELDAIYQDIDKMERTKFNVKQFSRRGELYQPFAIAAFVVLLLEILLRTVVLKRLP
ncbi:MAG: VWA domain-containing protein [Bacteroidaceae bacterium]|jgi:Ca-activated chloride channel family protein|nr:VWA domain-containing protein [Bacteroidaceae bacterium]MCI6802106.1 VWA domain-containing protein [Prevotellaceae bacterium]MBQ8709465.1 VWA domain-containing protein [Bacteroidaceae bacterium]MBR1492616.1 VWA domain-containing protein [Bacteroidaceae bacterium]MBS7322543.1 VWA domain-containing protein [Bacteroidaceae bacterium]